ncbi:MAG: type III-A CRISPR-associated RAMP protein Csm3 [Candidatus Binataceae bacterium]
MAKWTHVHTMKFVITLLDGMRVGGAGGGLEIGGVDPNLMALKEPLSGEPYIPGSSLKGKLRSILEKERGLNRPCDCGKSSCSICPVFGAHTSKPVEYGTPRLVVRDAHLTPTFAKKWRENPVYEAKTENIVNRSSGKAEHPRTQERVPAGADFQVEMLLKVFEGDKPEQRANELKHALAVLERFDALGAGGSRGSGRIKIEHLTEETVPLAGLTLSK